MMAPHVRTRKIKEPSRLAGIGRGLNAHRMVAETAIKLAEACYEAHMSANNDLYRAFRENLTEKQARVAFVARIAPTMLEEARLALVDCLAQPDDICPVAMKDQILEALTLDNDLRANRSVAAQNSNAMRALH